MQNGFFDELLKDEESNENEIVDDGIAADGVNATEEEKDVTEEIAEINFGDLKNEANENEKDVAKKQEQEAVKETPKPKEEKKQDSKAKKMADNGVSQPQMENVSRENEKPKKQEKSNSKSGALVKKDFTQALIEKTLDKITDITTYSEEVFSQKAKNCAIDIITSIDHTLNVNGYLWDQIDSKGSNLIMQIKRWAKLGIDVSNDKLYCDLRRNGKTGLYDIAVKGQYQTIEKLIANYFNKSVFRFKTEVICVGDDFQSDFDYATGEDKVISFTKNMKVDRNKMENIVGAFKILYYYDDDNKIHQIVTKIEKDRIMRAYEAAATKNVWNRDTQKMVMKTVTWEMFNGENIRPFMKYPEDIIQDLSVVNENEDIDFNKEHKYQNVVEAETHSASSLGTDDERVGF